MNNTELTNFARRIENYLHDNIRYIKEEYVTPSAQDALDHWDTNGPEGIGEGLTDDQRAVFLQCAANWIADNDDNDELPFAVCIDQTRVNPSAFVVGPIYEGDGLPQSTWTVVGEAVTEECAEELAEQWNQENA